MVHFMKLFWKWRYFCSKVISELKKTSTVISVVKYHYEMKIRYCLNIVIKQFLWNHLSNRWKQEIADFECFIKKVLLNITFDSMHITLTILDTLNPSYQKSFKPSCSIPFINMFTALPFILKEPPLLSAIKEN